MIPQARSIGEQRKGVCTRIDFYVRSPKLNLDEVTRLLRVEPTWGFEAGAPCISKMRVGSEIREVQRHRPSFGVWHFDTSCFTAAGALEEHGVLLLAQFEQCSAQIQQLMQNPEYAIGLTIWHVGPAGFELSSNVLARLSVISQSMSFTCWETEDDTAIDSPEESD